MAPKCPAPKRHGAELSSAESAAPEWPSPHYQASKKQSWHASIIGKVCIRTEHGMWIACP